MRIKSEPHVHATKIIQNHGSFSVTDLLKLCENQINLLRDDDLLIGRMTARLSEYEQELYDKDVYIKELENELKHSHEASNSKEDIYGGEIWVYLMTFLIIVVSLHVGGYYVLLSNSTNIPIVAIYASVWGTVGGILRGI